MKLKLGSKTYEVITNQIKCGTMTDFYDVYDIVEESERINKRTTKNDFVLIKEFIVTLFDNQFTTADLDENLPMVDLMAFWMTITKEINDKTIEKMEKILKK